jgi:drug/metabolite transporter (DMT)-like permease
MMISELEREGTTGGWRPCSGCKLQSIGRGQAQDGSSSRGLVDPGRRLLEAESTFAASKYAAGLVSLLVFIALRFTLGRLLLLGVLRAYEPASRLKRRELLPMAALGCFGVAAAQTGFTYGVSMTSAASTALIFATDPVWGLRLGAALGLERSTRRGIIEVALSGVGVGVVILSGAWGPGARASSATSPSRGPPGAWVLSPSCRCRCFAGTRP